MMLSKIHLAAALLATLTIAAFLSSTVIVEAFGSREAIARLKGLIVVPGLVVLVLALAATGGTGFARARGWKGRLVAGKRKRMPVIAGNGLLILTPAAILLNRWAAAGTFDTWFYVVQAIELIAGGKSRLAGIERPRRALLEWTGPSPADRPLTRSADH